MASIQHLAHIYSHHGHHVSTQVTQLDPADFILDYGELGNFSVAGFEMQLRRHVSHYLITYYLPSGDYDYDFLLF